MNVPATRPGHGSPTAGPIVRLRIVGPDLSRVVTLGLYPATIGSSAGNTVRVSLPGVAARHLEIDHDGAGGLTVADQSGGVASADAVPARLNGRPFSCAPLRDRDRLELADLRVQAFFPSRGHGPMIGSPKAKVADRDGLVLEGIDEPAAGRLIRVPETADAPLFIGRRPQCGMCLPHPRVSGSHAAIVRRAGGTHVLVDMGSRNGTCINGRPVEPREQTPLAAGDILEIGPIAMLVRAAQDVPPPQLGTIEVGEAEVAAARRAAALPAKARVSVRLEANPSGRRGPAVPQPAVQARPQHAPARGSDRVEGADSGEADVAEPVGPPSMLIAREVARRWEGQSLRGPMLLAVDPAPADVNAPPEAVPLPGSTALIGRSASADVALGAASVSATHAYVEPIGHGAEYIVRDAESSNGVWVNDTRVRQHVLQHLDTIRVGPYEFLFVAPGCAFPTPEVTSGVYAAHAGDLPIADWRPLPLVALELVSLAAAGTTIAVLGLAYAGVLPPLERFWSLAAEALRAAYG